MIGIGKNDIIEVVSECWKHSLTDSINPDSGRIESSENYTTTPHFFPPASNFIGGVFMHYDLDYFRDKFNQSYSIDPLTGCWLWQRTITNNGYAIIWDGRIRKASAAHRVSYELHKGQIPEGLDLDHLCRVRHCVNPSHLEAVTRKVNTLRGIGPAAVNAQKTHCPKGHPYDEQNTYYAFNPQGGKGRHCLTCQNIRNNINSKIRSLKRVRKPRKTKLTEQDVVSIRKIYSEGGYSFAQLGKKYGVTPSAIAMVVWRKNWANVS